MDRRKHIQTGRLWIRKLRQGVNEFNYKEQHGMFRGHIQKYLTEIKKVSPKWRLRNQSWRETRLYLLMGLRNNFFIFQDRVSRCSLGFPGISSENQAGLHLRNPLPMPPEHWDYRHVPPPPDFEHSNLLPPSVAAFSSVPCSAQEPPPLRSFL